MCCGNTNQFFNTFQSPTIQTNCCDLIKYLPEYNTARLIVPNCCVQKANLLKLQLEAIGNRHRWIL